MWPDSNLVQAVVIAPDGRRAYVPHIPLQHDQHGAHLRHDRLPLVSQIDLVNRTHLVGQQLDLGVLDPPGVGLPFDAAVTPDGGELWGGQCRQQ